MADLIVNGGKPLSGTIVPSGNKNSALPVLCATLLAAEPVRLLNVPAITDLENLVAFFVAQGSRITWDRAKGEMRVDHAGFRTDSLHAEMPAGMRSTVLLFAALLGKMKRVVLPASARGCSLGIRELDPHLDILQAFGAQLVSDAGLTLTLDGRYKAARYWQDYMSVTATENFLMAAAMAEGASTLINAASEPHVQDLCAVLGAMGARIEGIGTSVLRVEGVAHLHGGTFTLGTDYHEVVTFLALGAITGGEVRVERSLPHQFDLIARAFGKLGVEISHDGTTAVVRAGQKLAVTPTYTPNLLPKIEAAPWPYFPVDLLPCMIALAVRARGEIQFWNKVYEGGFTWLPELAKFGAQAVLCDPHRVIVFGDRPLRPAIVESPYVIRAAVALYMIAASIPGQSVVRNAGIIQRAHPRFVENLRALGADVEWTS